MFAQAPTILALDFDGVLCDGLLEYFQTTKRAYCEIWQPYSPEALDEFAPSFYQLRPVIETGWEMPILLRALVLGIPQTEILQTWSWIAENLVAREGLAPTTLSSILDTSRDRWIAADLDSWLQLHRFYPGTIARLRQILASSVELYIVTTKEGRFVQQLLQRQALELPSDRIIGKESQQPKYQTLQQLLDAASPPDPTLWFVEDRLATLQLVQQKLDLQPLRLFLADWGYNTATAKEDARQDPQIQLLSLSQFQQEFDAWLS